MPEPQPQHDEQGGEQHEPRRDAPYVSRGAHKLAAALDAFGIDPAGRACADLGCSTGGFTDCLLRRGAARVFAVDTAYGELAWSLRNDPRVTVMERTNALHADPPAGADVTLAAIDLGWTKLERAVPAAARWLPKGGEIVALIKPQYEAPQPAGRKKPRGPRTIADEQSREIAHECVETLRAEGFDAADPIQSPVRGGARRKGASGAGNLEWLTLVRVPPTA